MGALVAAGCSDLIGADWERYKPGGGEGAAAGSGGGAAAGSSGEGAAAGNGGEGAAAGSGGEGAASGSGGEGAAAGSGGEAGGCGLNGDGGSGAGAGGGPISSMAPSCLTMATRCGPDGISCCDSRLVDGGAYTRSYEDATGSAEQRRAIVNDFWLDTYEITVGRFREFVEAGKGTRESPPEAGAGEHPALPGSGWKDSFVQFLQPDTETLMVELRKCTPPDRDTCSAIGARCSTWSDTVESDDDERRPMNCITWHEAMAFCAWDGGRLPTEAEWSYAAVGGDEERSYPWGDTADEDRAVFGCYGYTEASGRPCTIADLLPVGSRSSGDEATSGDGKWGQADLAGSLWEWTLDGYSDEYPISSQRCDLCDNCANLTAGSERVMRGGCFDDDIENLTTSHRLPGKPAERYYGLGARCARDR
ncbi:formylglycine-generating enzyme family protein [Sorangium sp. So ce363]|uniref:formylglycine-generating enzyme family protein n=1 Tax=Sorangium sp. So ce363 TaxID=3133304 RepID=UPI003F61342D